MVKISKHLPSLCLLLLLVACWGGSLMMSQKLSSLSGDASVRYTDGAGISPAQVSRAIRYGKEDGNNSFPELTLWRESRDQALSDGTFRTASADVLEIFGDGSRLMPVTLHSGSLPAKGDLQGCAVSEDVAQSLWGSSDVVGKILVYNDFSYTVRGVFKGSKNLVFVQGGADEEKAYPALLLTFTGEKSNITEDTQHFLTRYGLSAGDILDMSLLLWVSSFLSTLPAAVLILWLILGLLREWYRLRHTPLLSLLFFILAAGIACLAVWAGNLMGLPQNLIPTQWSDFDYWGKLFQTMQSSLDTALRLPLTARDMQVWSAALPGLLLSLSAAALSVPLMHRLQAKNLNELGLRCGIWLTAVFAASMTFAAVGGAAQNRGFWLTVPMILVVSYAQACFQRHFSKKEGLDEKELGDHGRADEEAVPAAERR